MTNRVTDYSKDRYEYLEGTLAGVRQSIEEAARDCSAVRTGDSALPRLTVVTKFFPASDVAALYDLGVRDVGENRDQEASAKAQQLLDYADSQDRLKWSYIGQLQTNKAKSVVKYASEVHSVDRASLVKALAKAYDVQVSRYENGEAAAPAALVAGGLGCYVQVNLDEVATAGQAAAGKRGGSAGDEVLALAEQIESSQGLYCAGVMAVAPLGAEADVAFEKLWGISQKLREQYPHADQISAGMSGDMEAAIRWGSTNVRVGSQIMGPRPLVH